MCTNKLGLLQIWVWINAEFQFRAAPAPGFEPVSTAPAAPTPPLGEIGLGVGDTEFTPDEVARRLVEYQADNQFHPIQPDVDAGLDAIQASSTVLNALGAWQFAASLRGGVMSVEGILGKQYAWRYHRLLPKVMPIE